MFTKLFWVTKCTKVFPVAVDRWRHLWMLLCAQQWLCQLHLMTKKLFIIFLLQILQCIKKEYMFLYSAVSSPLDCSKRVTLHPLAACSIRHQLDFSEKHSAMLKLFHKYYPHTFPSLSIARCSFIQLSELGGHGENENAELQHSSKGDSNPCFLDWESSWLQHSSVELPCYYYTLQATTKVNVHAANHDIRLCEPAS